ncbi:MAG: helix-turn-helix transcriptional regulator [Pseudonocardiaceae bacterium]
MKAKRHALADRRETVGHTQETLAESVGVEPTTIGRWERGETSPQPWSRPKLAEALAVSVEQLDTMLTEGQPTEPQQPVAGESRNPTPANEPTDDPEHDPVLIAPWNHRGTVEAAVALTGGDGRVKRSLFLCLTGPALTAPAHQWLVHEPEPLVSGLAGRRLSAGVADRLPAMIAELRAMDDVAGGGDVLSLARYHFGWVAGLLDQASYDDVTGRKLHSALAELGQLVGWAYYDTGQHGLAQRYHITALRAAHSADDRPLGAHILSALAYQTARQGQPTEAVTLSETAVAGTRSWVGGSHPWKWASVALPEALSHRPGRTVTLDDTEFTIRSLSARTALDWRRDTLISLTELGKVDVDMERRRVLAAATYSLATLAVPDGPWWTQLAARGSTRATASARVVGRSDLEAVREMTSIFSRVDQRRGGGHARTALVQYLTSDVVSYLRGSYHDEQVRKDMFSAASELAYLSGWMAFDNAEHSIAQRYFSIAVKLAAEAADPPMAGHIFRAMAHQAIDLGHFHHGLDLATASMDSTRYILASPRERALFGVVYARALGAAGQKSAAAKALITAEDDLASATSGDDEPSRVFFFGEASLAHQTACTLRDTGDLSGALKEFRRSVRTRKAATFTRTHALTLGHLDAIEARQGEIEQACSTWSTALDAMDGIHSGRTRQAVADMRLTLSPFCRRGIPATIELDVRAFAYLNSAP